MREGLARLLEERKLSQVDFAKLIGRKQSYVNQILTGKRNIGDRIVKEICASLQIDELDLLKAGLNNYSAIRSHNPIPVISWIQAGEFKEAIDAWPVGVSGEAEPVYTDVKVSQYAFGLRVVGDSMEPRFLEGDIIIVDPEIRPQTGDYCVAWLSGEVTFKKLQEKQDEILLVPLNEKHAELKISKNRKVDFKLIGKVVDMKPKIY